jgi:hypothetical protein
MSTRNSSIRPIATATPLTGQPGVGTTADRRAREKAAIELARREAMADPLMRTILAALAKR